MAKKRPQFTRAQMLRDPAKRRDIPTSQLPARYRIARQRRLSAERDARNPLYNPAAPLTGRNLRRTVNQLVEAETRPAIESRSRQIENTLVQAGELGRRTTGLAQGVAASDRDASARQEAISQRAREGLARIASEGQNAVNETTSAAQERMNEAVSTGLQGSAAERLAAERAALGARQADTATQYRSSNEVLSANDETYQNRMGATNQARLAERAQGMQNRQSNRMADLAAERASIEASRGPLTTKTLLGLRQQGFTNMATTETLGLKQADLQEDQRQANQNAAIKRQGIRTVARTNRANRLSREQIASLNRQNQRSLTKERLSQSERSSLRSAGIDPDTRKPIPGGKLDPKAGNGKDQYGNTVKDRRAAQSKYDNARIKAAQYATAAPGMSWQELRDFLVSSKNVDSVYATAAAQRAVLGRVGAGTKSTLRERGVSKFHISRAGRTLQTPGNAPSGKRGRGGSSARRT